MEKVYNFYVAELGARYEIFDGNENIDSFTQIHEEIGDEISEDHQFEEVLLLMHTMSDMQIAQAYSLAEEYGYEKLDVRYTKNTEFLFVVGFVTG